jgi:Na+-transporting NADH:ubiquinone oxidoreductase subunit NqrE
VNTTGFYLLFIPGLTLAVVGTGFLVSAFAMRQGPFQPSTRFGLGSLIGVLLALVVLVGVEVAGGYAPVYPPASDTGLHVR